MPCARQLLLSSSLTSYCSAVYQVPIEKIFNKSLLAKFNWSMDVEPGFHF